MTPIFSSEEFCKRVKFYSTYFELFKKTDTLYNTLYVKNIVMKYYKKIKNLKFLYTFLYENKEETNDIHSIEKNSDEFIDLIFIFKHKWKYTIEIYANDINKKK